MRKLFLFYFLIFIFNIGFVNADLNIDKGKLNFNMFTGETFCDTIKLFSQNYAGLITVRDIWAVTFEETGGFNTYNVTAQYHNISINYQNNITNFVNEYESEVCLTANKIGDFKGLLIFTPQAEGNMVVEVGTWILVNITEQTQTEQQNQENSKGSTASSSSGSSSSSNSGTSQNVAVQANTKNIEKEIVKVEKLKEEQKKEEISGEIVTEIKKENKPRLNWLFSFIAFGVAIFLISLYVYIKKRRSQKWV